MEFEENERIIIPDENGEEQLFEILFHFDIEATNKSYIITTPVDQEQTDDDEEEGIEVLLSDLKKTVKMTMDCVYSQLNQTKNGKWWKKHFYTLTEEE